MLQCPRALTELLEAIGTSIEGTNTIVPDLVVRSAAGADNVVEAPCAKSGQTGILKIRERLVDIRIAAELSHPVCLEETRIRTNAL